MVVPWLGCGPQVSSCHEGSSDNVDVVITGPVQAVGTSSRQLVEPGEVAEVDSQVGGQDGVLNDQHDLGILCWSQSVQDPVTIKVEDDQGLVEVMSLQSGAGVQFGQGGVGSQLVTVVGA